MKKDIKLLIENIFQRKGARELLNRSKAEELDVQIRKMYLYRPKTKYELENNIIECLENKIDLNLIDVSEIDDFFELFTYFSYKIGYRLGDYIFHNEITSIDISGWYINPDANVNNMFCKSTLQKVFLPVTLTKIGNSMFTYSKLTSVTIPNSVTSVGFKAFSGCSGLTSVTIPDSVTYIGDYAFTDYPKLNIYVNDVDEFKRKFNNYKKFCKASQIKPIKEKTINENIFQREGARELLKRSKAEELDNQIRKMYLYHPTTKDELKDNIIECFKNETDLNLIDVSDIGDFKELFSFRFGWYDLNDLGKYIKDNKIKQIDISGWYINPNANMEDMFHQSTLNEVILPHTIQKIAFGMFRFSHIKTIDIPDSVTEISDGTFFDCKQLENITMPQYVTKIGYDAFIDTKWYDKQPDGLIYIGYVAYSYKGTMPEDTNIVLKENTISISERAFSGCENLKGITIPNSVTSIGKYAFSGCSSLTSVKIPNSVTTIGDGAFKHCFELNSITIPNTVDFIGDDAFTNCFYLTIYVDNVDEFKRKFPNVRLERTRRQLLTGMSNQNRIKPINENIFQREGARELLKRSKAEELDAQIRKMYLYHPKTREELEDNIIECLENKTDLNSIDVSDIDNFVDLFKYDNDFEEEIVGEYIANNGIEKIDISNWEVNTKAVEKMFKGSTLKEVILPNNIQLIGPSMFHSCWRLENIIIPITVKKIGAYAFFYCINLKSVTIPNSVETIDGKAFALCDKLETIYVDDIDEFYYKFSDVDFCYARIKSINKKENNKNNTI